LIKRSYATGKASLSASVKTSRGEAGTIGGDKTGARMEALLLSLPASLVLVVDALSIEPSNRKVGMVATGNCLYDLHDTPYYY
jgi:hypothetical protein